MAGSPGRSPRRGHHRHAARRPVPPTKDVDIHLVFDEGSPALQAANPHLNIIAASRGGIAIEAGIKSVTEYESAAAVLANPEIAYHLTRDPILLSRNITGNDSFAHWLGRSPPRQP